MELMKKLINRNAHLLIAMVPVLIYFVSCFLFELNGKSSLTIKNLIVDEVKKHPSTISYAFIEYKSQILWLSSSLLSIIAYGVALIWSSIIFARCCRPAHSIHLLVAGTAIISFNLLLLIKADSTNAIYNHIFDTTYQALRVCPLISLTMLNMVHHVILLINLLATVAPVFILIAISCAIASPTDTENLDLKFFVDRMNYLKQGIMIGSLILLFGLIHMDVWMQWPVELIEAPDIKDKVQSSLVVISQFWGIAYSLILISFYATAVYFWRYRTSLYLVLSSPQTDISAWLDDNGFTFSWHKHVLQIGTMLTPFLAGSLRTGLDLLPLN
ncbi:hypothetical protein [Methylomicrobium lacus]|uniref:hypothetical protein n=1 Tax=Methylomicrobium lacus TaxID=136992 RepID=UPI0035A94239